MKAPNTRKLLVLTVVAYVAASPGCSMVGQKLGLDENVSKTASTSSAVTTGGSVNTGSPGSTTGVTSSGSDSVSTTVANVDNVSTRIQNALTLPATTASPSPVPLVNPLSGNFATVLAQQGPNLATTTNPNTATGAGAIPLLAYAACNDAKASAYGVTTSGTVAAQTANLVNAGLTIVNQCTAGLAASGTSLNSQVASIFTTLITSNAAASPAATTAQDFISVCTAATSFCVSMMSF